MSTIGKDTKIFVSTEQHPIIKDENDTSSQNNSSLDFIYDKNSLKSM
jgi:hypothetical protein